MTASFQLQQLIEERTAELSKYALKPDASDFYIDKENKFIESLVEIYNGIETLQYQDLWKVCEKSLFQLKEMDDNFSGVDFQIRFKAKGHLAMQVFNLFDNGA